MNRIVGNVIIIDSAMGNVVMMTSANQVMHLDDYSINAIGVWSVDTTANVTLTLANTAADLQFKYTWLQGGTNGAIGVGALQLFPFASPQRIGDLKAPVVTAVTAFLYLA